MSRLLVLLTPSVFEALVYEAREWGDTALPFPPVDPSQPMGCCLGTAFSTRLRDRGVEVVSTSQLVALGIRTALFQRPGPETERVAAAVARTVGPLLIAQPSHTTLSVVHDNAHDAVRATVRLIPDTAFVVTSSVGGRDALKGSHLPAVPVTAREWLGYATRILAAPVTSRE